MKRIAAVFLLMFSTMYAFSQDSFSDWKKQQESQFKAFLDKQDQDFANFIKKEWEQFQAYKAVPFDTAPKPILAPMAPVTDAQGSVGGRVMEEQNVNLSAAKAGGDVPQAGVEKTAGIEKTAGFDKPVPGVQNVKADFMDRTLYIPYAQKLDFQARAPYNNTQFSGAWTAMGTWDSKPFLAQLSIIRDTLGLNDWGYFLLLNAAASGMFPGDSGKSGIFTWFLLIKSGYDAKLCYFQNKVYLLIPAENMIYNTLYMYFAANGPYYYVFENNRPAQNVTNIYTYRDDYPGKKSLVKMKIDTAPRLTERKYDRDLSFVYEGKRYKIAIEANESYVLLGNQYPQTDMAVYFTSPPSAEARHTLVNSLKIITAEKSEQEAVNMILRFVQTAFEYQTDDEQFGIEKPLFIDETLYYPYSDCEDRSILFAFLVREIVGLSVVGLDYPGHIATAVRFSTNVKGDSISYKGQRYVVCDPTYINADVGMTMPQFKNVAPGIIETAP